MQLCLWIFWRLGETRKNSSATSRRCRRHFRQSKTTFRSKKAARQPRRKSSTISSLTLTIYPHLWRRMALWRGGSAREIFWRFPHPKPSPRSRPRRYERRLSPPSTNKHVEITGEPGAREVSVVADQMVLLWTAGASMLASQTTGLERPTPGAGSLVLATPSTGKERPIPGVRVLGTAAPSAGKEGPVL